MILNVSFIGTRYYAAINTNTLKQRKLSSLPLNIIRIPAKWKIIYWSQPSDMVYS